MRIPFKSDPVDAYQHQLFPGNVFDLLPEDHDCFLFYDLIQQIDVSDLEKKYSPIGQRAYHPLKIIGILIYGYSHGVFSSRQLEKRCKEDLSFMYMAGKNCPNFRVLSDFRKNHGEFFQDCFKQTVKLAMEMKLVSLGHVSLDGSKFKANSSKHKAMSYRFLKEREQSLCEEIEELVKRAESCDEEEDAAYQEKTGYEVQEDLIFKQSRLNKIREAKQALEKRESELHPGEEIEDKKQISFADTDAQIMGKKGDFDYRYNGQVSVDSDHQIIVGQHVSQKANDKQEVKEGLASIADSTGRLPEKMSLDNGYFSGSNIEALAEAEVDAYVAVGRGEKMPQEKPETSENILNKDEFTYDPATDSFLCPRGQRLTLKGSGKSDVRRYQGDKEVCASCPFYSRCCQSTKGAARTITTDSQEELRQRMKDYMQQPESKEVYKKRKVIVEPVFGHIKNGGFRRFSLRGKDKVAGEFSLVCIAHNMKKMVKAAMTGIVCPDFGNGALKAG